MGTLNDKIRKPIGTLVVSGANAGNGNYNNALTVDAPEMICKNLAGVNNHIDTIAAYKLGGLLAARTGTPSYPATNKVKFTATFDGASFNDTLDELRLVSSASTEFSTVVGLSITKNGATTMAVEWTLEVV